jgi:hypothetical protein
MLSALLACSTQAPLILPTQLHLQIGDGDVVTVRSEDMRLVEPSIVGDDVVVESWLVGSERVDPGHPLDLGIDAYVVGDWPSSGAYMLDLVLTSTDIDGSDPVEQTVPVTVVVP